MRRPDLGVLVVTGKDRVSWLNGLLTADLVKRPAGAAVYGLFVARSGKVMADAMAVLDDEAQRVLLVVPRRGGRGAARPPRPLPRDGGRRDGAR